MNKLIWKGLLMTIVTFVATSITTSGIPSSSLAWEILGITTVGTVIGYIAQSVALPSTSILGGVNLRDLLKGGLLAISNMLSGFAASAITSTVIDWKALLTSMGMVLVCLLYTSPSPRDRTRSRMPSSA